MGGITIKEPEDLARMRSAGRVVRAVLNRMREMVAPGVTTRELDAEAERLCLSRGAECLFKGVPSLHGTGPFPGAICASLNEQVVHGIPSDRRIVEGDVVSIDFGARLDGWCADAAETFIVGEAPEPVRRLVETTRDSLALAIRLVRPGMMWSAIAAAIQDHIESAGFSVVRDLAGHGIGREMWELPSVPNFHSRRMHVRDFPLMEGITLAVEPMANLGGPGVRCEEDGWTMVTRDRKPSAHFEQTLAITAEGVEVLTGAG